MYKRSAIIICVAVFLFQCLIFTVSMAKTGEQPTINAFGKGVSADGYYYYADDGGNGMRLFKIDSLGNVENIYTIRDVYYTDLCVTEDNLYVLVEEGIRYTEEGRFASYRLRQFDKKLRPVATSCALEIHPSQHAVDIGVEGDQLFLSGITADGKTAEAYALSVSELMAIGDAEKEQKKEIEKSGGEYTEPDPVTAFSFDTRETEAGRFFSDAAYRGGEFYLRTDADPAVGIFAVEPGLSEAVRNAKFSLGEKIRLNGSLAIYYAAGTFITVILLALCFLAFYNRRRLIYTGLLIEIIFITMLIVFYSTLANQSKELLKQARRDYADNGINNLMTRLSPMDSWTLASEYDGWFISPQYRGAQNELAQFMSEEGNKAVFYDVFVMRVSDGEIICSVSGKNGETANETYGNSKLWTNVSQGVSSHNYDLVVAGRSFSVMGMLDNGEKSEYALIGVINENLKSAGSKEKVELVRNMLLIFFVGSALLTFILFLANADLRRFEEALSDMAKTGRSLEKKPTVLGHDLDNMWNSLGEIGKRMDMLDYNRFKIYEAYYRFAPKSIEKLLEKESIHEVKCGDAVRIKGTIAYLSGDRKAEADIKVGRMSTIISFMSAKSDKNAVMIGNTNDLCLSEILFTDDARNTQEFAVDILQELDRTEGEKRYPESVFLYHDEFIYGIAGIESQSRPYLLNDNEEYLLGLSELFESLKIPVVITEDVKDREGSEYDLRYIGYFLLGEDKKQINCYEVLDAFPKAMRQSRTEDMGRFHEALKLFYQKDYYMARNAFSDILKNNTTDEVARWYLFEVEHLLDKGNKADDRAGALHI